jgi:hypothetical protein
MGQQARMRRERRSALRGHQQTVREIDAVARTEQVQARLAEEFWDDECAALRDADAAGQVARLRAGGWRLAEQNNDGIGYWRQRQQRLSLIHSVAREQDGQAWAHVSVATAENTMPTWYELRNAGWLMYPGRFGIVVVAPEGRHVNIANVAHIWYCLTARSCPDFSHGMGSI